MTDSSQSQALARSSVRFGGAALWVGWTGLAVFLLIIGVISAQRVVFGYDTETDYLGGFVPEARRFLAGESLLLEFHPPLYAMVIAIARVITSDWMMAGLAVSFLSAAAILVMSFALFRGLLGTGAALGSGLALMFSPYFVYFSTRATSEVFSLALHLGALLAVYASVTRPVFARQLAAGAVIGFALLCRTNNIALLALLLCCFVPASGLPGKWSFRRGMVSLGITISGICLPLLAWAMFATYSGAPLAPSNTYQNLALTFYSDGGRISSDELRAVAGQFESTADVLLTDPARVASIYVRDLANTVHRLFLRDTVLAFPLVALAAVCWLIILAVERERRILIGAMLISLVGMLLLLNFKAYEHRYFLFLVPFAGGGIGYVCARLLAPNAGLKSTAAGLAAVAVLAALLLIKVPGDVQQLLAANQSTDAYAAARHVGSHDEAGRSVVYARKPHLDFYAGADRGRFPPSTADVGALVTLLRERHANDARHVYVFYGVEERAARPKLSDLSVQGRVVDPALRTVAQGAEREGWVLYEFIPSAGAR